MTGFQARRTPLLTGLPPGRAKRLVRATTLAACASLVAGCGVIPGTTGGTGDGPVTVMTWAPEKTAATNKPGMPAMAKAYARWVNANGGINGHELKIITCNDHNETVSAAKCARRAADESAVAVVGSYSQHGRSYIAPLESANIPYIGGYGVTDDEFASALSYPVNGGQASLMAGLGEQLAEACGPVALVRPDSIAGDQLPLLLDSGLRSGGHDGSEDQLAAEDATEYGGHAREALRRAAADPAAEGCVVPALGDRTFTFMDSFRRDREDFPDVRTGTVLGSVDQTVIDATGGRSGPYEGAYVTGWYPVESDQRWDQMKKVIREHAFDDNRIDPADPGVQTTWIAYTVLKAAIEKIGGGEVTSQAIRRVLDDGLEVTTGGLTPPLSWRFEDLIASAGFPRIINPEVTFQIVRKGQLVAARRGFVNVEETLVEADS
ncbi:ABC transporter substrate-binding protein [Streptomyces sp. NBC_01314]|uniref:ABC transporter substrate-binding protein n=1 Tax=Streptomyces sp. NBC_01314 TaxID=2903821 RepID=UPI003086C0A6|nr:ABC transporter substrate-binding protein [Streptomyces sp. NBC_01314]